MDIKTMRWLLSSGLVATGLTGCADPCADDGLLQSEASECPADSGGASDTESDSETVTVTDGETESDSETLETDSDGGGDCMDGMQNGDETDVDCGGTCTEKCDDGEGCMIDNDCMSDDCSEDDICQGVDPECTDGQQNGDETDVDCGNSCGATCEDGEGCDDGADCISGMCNEDTLTCDPGVPVSYCVDADDDGFGDPDTCVDVPPGQDPPDGSVPNGDDCADDNANAFPGAAEEEPELCAEDEDGDGYGDASPPDGVDPGSDCVDTEFDIYPGAAEMEPELCTADVDDDGYGDDSATDIDPGADNGTDCADDNVNAFPGSAPNDSPTACLEDEDDDDYGDADPPDGVTAGTDCNDMDPSVPFLVVGIPDDCPTAELLDGSLGCEFYGIPLANLNASTYNILLANANPALTATVNIEQFVGGAWAVISGPITLAPLQQSTEVLPENFSPTTEINEGGSYRVTSDIPIAAYQASIATFTSDASLLIPRASWDVEYDIVGYDGSFGEEYVAITAAEDGTEIEIVPSRATLAGGGLPAVPAGGLLTLMLDEGDTAVIMSAPQNQTVAEGLSGSIVTSTAPIGVFSGSECSNIPTGVLACDHLEEMLTPTNTAATSVVAARMPPRGVVPEPVVWQIYAVEDATVSFEAPLGVTGLPIAPVDLVSGQSLELSVSGTVAEPGDFVIDSTAPIIVSQYLTGATGVGATLPGSASGDPAHVVMAGASQLLEAYVVGTVEGNVIDHLTITRQVGSAAVALDGVDVPAADFSAITAEWEVARIEVGEGTHSLLSDDPISVVVSGYNSANSYAYLGGGQARALACE